MTTLNANLKATVAGLDSGDSLTKFELVIMLEATDYLVGTDLTNQSNLNTAAAAALAAGRYAVYNAGADTAKLAALQSGSGYDETWVSNIVYGNYTAAARVTETRTGGAVVVGPWSKWNAFSFSPAGTTAAPTTTTAAPGSPPAAPTGVSAYAVGATNMQIQWNAAAGATSYNLYYKLHTDSTYTKLQNVTSIYQVGSLTTGAAYDVYIEAVNADGAAQSSVIAVTPGSATTAAPTTTTAAPTTAAPGGNAEFAGSGVDSGFSAHVYGSGTVTVSGGAAAITSPGPTDAAIIRRDVSLPSNKVFTITVKGQGNGSDVTNMNFLSILQQPAAPAPSATDDAAISAASRIDMVLRPGAGYLLQYKGPGTNNFPRWTAGSSNWNTGTGFTAGIVSGTQYVFKLESDGTQFRMTIYAADGTTVIVQTGWVLWSAVDSDGNPLWLYVGDVNTEWNTCSMSVDYIRIS